MFDGVWPPNISRLYSSEMFGDQTPSNIVWWPNMFDTRLSKRTKHRPPNTITKEMFQLFDRMFDGLQMLSKTTKQRQTRWPNGKMFGHQRKFDGVWSPNISRLSRALCHVHVVKTNHLWKCTRQARLRTFARKFSNIDFFRDFYHLKLMTYLCQKCKKMGGHRLRLGENKQERTP